MGKKVVAPKTAQPRGFWKACSPRKLLNLGSQKCHSPLFLQDTFGKLISRIVQYSVFSSQFKSCC